MGARPRGVLPAAAYGGPAYDLPAPDPVLTWVTLPRRVIEWTDRAVLIEWGFGQAAESAWVWRDAVRRGRAVASHPDDKRRITTRPGCAEDCSVDAVGRQLTSLLPTVLRDWWGFFLPGGPMERLSALVVIDYQNIHLTARDTFAPNGTHARDCLVHPLLFAEQVLQTRSRKLALKAMTNPGSPPAQPVDLAEVRVFRGQPSNAKQSDLYAASQAQRSEWTRDRRVSVTYRRLKYHFEHGVELAQEKGIDVMVALELVRAADRSEADIVILASHDTDLEPALDAAAETGNAQVETAGWSGCRVLRSPGSSRHTSLDGTSFVASRDRKVYFPKR